jgi:hypothetical protein
VPQRAIQTVELEQYCYLTSRIGSYSLEEMVIILARTEGLDGVLGTEKSRKTYLDYDGTLFFCARGATVACLFCLEEKWLTE